MGKYVIDTRARSSAPPSAVFALLADGRTWPEWGAWTSFELESPSPGFAAASSGSGEVTSASGGAGSASGAADFPSAAAGSASGGVGSASAAAGSAAGSVSAEGPGAVRVFTSRTLGRTTVSRERILEVVPDRRVVYGLLSGLPLRNYVGRVELVPDGAGTVVHWHSEFDGAPVGSGSFYRFVLQRFIADAARRVARYAERVAPADGAGPPDGGVAG